MIQISKKFDKLAIPKINNLLQLFEKLQQWISIAPKLTHAINLYWDKSNPNLITIYFYDVITDYLYITSAIYCQFNVNNQSFKLIYTEHNFTTNFEKTVSFNSLDEMYVFTINRFEEFTK